MNTDALSAKIRGASASTVMFELEQASAEFAALPREIRAVINQRLAQANDAETALRRIIATAEQAREVMAR